MCDIFLHLKLPKDGFNTFILFKKVTKKKTTEKPYNPTTQG